MGILVNSFLLLTTTFNAEKGEEREDEVDDVETEETLFARLALLVVCPPDDPSS